MLFLRVVGGLIPVSQCLLMVVGKLLLVSAPQALFHGGGVDDVISPGPGRHLGDHRAIAFGRHHVAHLLHALLQRRVAVKRMGNAGGAHVVKEIIRGSVGQQAPGHRVCNAQVTGQFVVTLVEGVFSLGAVVGIGRDFDQGLRYGLGRDQLGGHVVGLELAVAVVTGQSQLKNHAVELHQGEHHHGQPASAHTLHIVVILLQLGAQCRAGLGIATAKVRQLVAQHSIGLLHTQNP